MDPSSEVPSELLSLEARSEYAVLTTCFGSKVTVSLWSFYLSADFFGFSGTDVFISFNVILPCFTSDLLIFGNFIFLELSFANCCICFSFIFEILLDWTLFCCSLFTWSY
jgi:hypothetical protein